MKSTVWAQKKSALASLLHNHSVRFSIGGALALGSTKTQTNLLLGWMLRAWNLLLMGDLFTLQKNYRIIAKEYL